MGLIVSIVVSGNSSSPDVIVAFGQVNTTDPNNPRVSSGLPHDQELRDLVAALLIKAAEQASIPHQPGEADRFVAKFDPTLVATVASRSYN